MRPETASDDAALVRAAQRGDRDAFASLVARYAPAILSVTSRMLGSTSDAEDMAQETFVAAYQALERFQFDASFKTWLYRIAMNKCTDSLRRRRPDAVPFEDGGSDSAAAATVPDLETPHWEYEQVELAWQLDQAVQALPPLYRESFVLRHIEGLDYDEMSRILGVHRDTLKMRVYKARTLLCRSLAHLEGAHR